MEGKNLNVQSLLLQKNLLSYEFLHKEVVRLDVPVDEVFTVDVFYSGDELVGQQEDGLEAEAPGAEVEEVLQARTQQLHHHHIVVSCTHTTLSTGTVIIINLSDPAYSN